MRLPALLLSALAFALVARAPSAVLHAAAAPSRQAAPPPCGVETRWLHDGAATLNRSSAHSFTLFSAVGHGCSASTTLSAAYFDQDDRLVCSGMVAVSLPVTANRPYRNIEVQAGNVYQYLRWVNGPSRTAQRWARLECRMPDDETEAQPTQFARATRLQLHATTRGSRGGIATAVLDLRLRP